MMSWFKGQKLSWLQQLCVNILKQGTIPQHVAFIMDGNRRFATKKNLKKIEGHVLGFDKLIQTLEWCMHLGITEVTVYAFSIENFKRSEEEVKALMELAKQKLGDLLKEKEKIHERGLCIRVAGDLTLLPKDLQQLIAEVVLLTENNDRMFLNVCLSYTSRHEMCSAIDDLCDGVRNGLIQPNDITESLFSSSLLVKSNPDLVLRTSGEIRLSDFLLWQSVYSVLAFLKVLWPEFDIWHFFLGVLFYQFSCKHTLETKKLHKAIREQLDYQEDLVNALSPVNLNVEEEAVERQHVENLSGTTQEGLTLSYTNDSLQRKNCYLDYIAQKRRKMFLEMTESPL